MLFDIVIEAYNRYIEKRRKELRIDSDVKLTFSLKSEKMNDTTSVVSLAVFYNHPKNVKSLMYQNVMYPNTLSGKNTAAEKLLARWIDFFSENEDRIVEGNVWM